MNKSPVVNVESIDTVRGKIVVGIFRAVGSVFPFGRYRPFSAALARLGAVLLAGSNCTVMLQGGGRFTFDLGDPYWLKLLMPGWWYEPEVDGVFTAAGNGSDIVHVVDCGANIGYWACRNAGFSNFHVTAVEPSQTVLPRLMANLKNVKNVKKLRQNAIWDKDGETLNFAISTKHHAGSAVADVSHHNLDVGDWTTMNVDTTTLDSIVAADRPADCTLTLVKLDVEGAETKALLGAKNLLSGNDFILIYEDHPTDHDNVITRASLDAGLTVYSNMPVGLRPIRNMDDINLSKVQSWWIYRFCNFIAFRTGGSAEKLVKAMAQNQTA